MFLMQKALRQLISAGDFDARHTALASRFFTLADYLRHFYRGRLTRHLGLMRVGVSSRERRLVSSAADYHGADSWRSIIITMPFDDAAICHAAIFQPPRRDARN